MVLLTVLLVLNYSGISECKSCITISIEVYCMPHKRGELPGNSFTPTLLTPPIPSSLVCLLNAPGIRFQEKKTRIINEYLVNKVSLPVCINAGYDEEQAWSLGSPGLETSKPEYNRSLILLDNLNKQKIQIQHF